MEMLAAITVIAAVASVAVPSTGAFYAGQRVAAEAKTFLADVRFARYEAMRTGTVHRLVLNNLAVENAYRIEAFEHAQDYPGTVTTADLANDANWTSVLDEASRGLGTDLTITVSPSSTIYLTPAGKLVDSWNWGDEGIVLSSRPVHFCYGNATMTVTLTGFGGFSSQEYFEE